MSGDEAFEGKLLGVAKAAEALGREELAGKRRRRADPRAQEH
jgi:hypothetical protein